MSDSGKGKREWRFYVNDMIEFAQKIFSYTAGLNQAAFVASELTYDATLRNLELNQGIRPLDLDGTDAEPSGKG